MYKILSFLFIFCANAFSAQLQASDIDMSTAISDITVVVLAILNVLILLFAHKKVLSMLGRWYEIIYFEFYIND